jgi:hypothetical protein
VEMRTSAHADAHASRSKHVFVISEIISRQKARCRDTPSPKTLSKCEARNDDVNRRAL